MSFDEKCKFCGDELDCVASDGRNMRGIAYVYWCPQCGAILDWYDNGRRLPLDKEWKQPTYKNFDPC